MASGMIVLMSVLSFSGMLEIVAAAASLASGRAGTIARPQSCTSEIS